MPLSNDTTLELAVSLLTSPDSSIRAGLLASALLEHIGDGVCIVYRSFDDSGANFQPIGMSGDVSLTSNPGESFLSLDDPKLAPLKALPLATVILPGNKIQREDYAHLHIMRSVASLAYIPLVSDEQLIGIVELLSFRSQLNPADLNALAPMIQLGPPALLAAEHFEQQRQNLLDSVHRMSQLYDLEKSLNATLELDQVIALAPEKVIAMLNCQAVHLWLFKGDDLSLFATGGRDATVYIGKQQAAGEGYVADMAEEGEPVLIDDPTDERLALRNSLNTDASVSDPVTTAMLVPLMQDDAEVGVLEAVNKIGRVPFDEDDQFFLSAIAETVSSALKNSSLMHAERKLAILEALVHVSSEITSTLRLDRLLQIIVNSPQSVLPFERCSIALDDRGRLQLKAVSGLASLPLGDTQVDTVHELLRWLSLESGALHLRQQDNDAIHDLPAPVVRHFELTGYRALFALPLTDDQGRVGLLLYEASDPDFLDLPHTEMIKILAGQATVAIRNALLYREVPLISFLEPLLQRKQSFFRSSRQRRFGMAAAAAAILLFLIFCPLPMRVSGEAVVAPQHIVAVAAPVDGNVVTVAVHEGQHVVPGQLLGSMNDWQWRSEMESAEAKSHVAELAMQANLAHGAAQAGADRAQVEFLHTEAARARERIENAQLRSPIAGLVATPNLQNAAGEHLLAGSTFAQILDLSSAVVDVSISQSEVSLLQSGQSGAIKLDSYPQQSWHGAIDIVSPEAQATEGERKFIARIPLPNANAILKAGMTGHAKIFIGYKPAGYVLLRGPALWLWQTLWNWIGW